jgi:hypothetical protein
VVTVNWHWEANAKVHASFSMNLVKDHYYLVVILFKPNIESSGIGEGVLVGAGRHLCSLFSAALGFG